MAKASATGKAMAKTAGKGRPGRLEKAETAKRAGSKKVRSSLLEKGRVDRKLVKAATTMTTEKWAELQKGMDEKWPLPEYMGGEKGHMQFKDETFSIVTRWTASTKIEYRPHAKRPGSKSHLRYESYSKARTVGEALRLGTYPCDWCWDFERGFIRVVGGEIREFPLDNNEIKDGRTCTGEAVTDVDRVIHTWYRRELAKQLGMSVADLGKEVPHAESPVIRGQRLLAQRDAKARLEAAEREGRAITDEEMLLTLKRWAFHKNPWRTNVMREGESWVYSDTLGLLRDRQGDIHLTAPTRRYPQVAELFARWLTDRLPADAKGFTFTSMNVNCNYAAQLHRDNGNFGPSFIKAFGEFSGGELNYWPEDAGGKLQALPKAKKVQFNLGSDLALFNGNCGHSVQDFSGTRYSVVYFTLGCHPDMLQSDRDRLQRLGIPCPAKAEDPFALLRPPRGYDGAAPAATPARAARGAQAARPAWRAWRAADLERARPKRTPAEIKKAAAAAHKRRLAPETERSFYTAEKRRKRMEEEGVFKYA